MPKGKRKNKKGAAPISPQGSPDLDDLNDDNINLSNDDMFDNQPKKRNKKKNKKNKKGQAPIYSDEDINMDNNNNDNYNDDESEIIKSFNKKQKKKNKKKKGKKGAAPISDDDGNDDNNNWNDSDSDEDIPVPPKNNKKQKKKNKKKGKKGAAPISDDGDDGNDIETTKDNWDDSDEDIPEPPKSNKKQKKKNKKKGKKGAAPISDDDDDNNNWDDNDDDVSEYDEPPIMNKKQAKKQKRKNKKKGKKGGAPISDDDGDNNNNWNDDDASEEEFPKMTNKQAKKQKKKKNKKGKKGGAPISDNSDNDDNNNNWDDNSDVSDEPAPPKKNKKQKKKNKKKGKKGAPISDDSDNDNNNKGWNDNLDESDSPPMNKKQRKKNKKKKGKQKMSISDDGNDGNDNAIDEFLEDTKPKKGKKKKNKKNKGKHQQNYDDNNTSNKPGKKKKKNKKNKAPQKSRQEILGELKEKKQTELTEYANDCFENCDPQYGKYFTDERKEMFDELMLEIIGGFGEDNLSDVENDEIYNQCKVDIDEGWDTILTEMKEEFENEQNDAEQRQLEQDREMKIKQFERMGMKVGASKKAYKGRGGGGASKRGKKKYSKKDLDALKQKLKEADELAKKQEREAELRQQQERERQAKEDERKKQQIAEQKKKTAASWNVDDDSDSSSSSNKAIKGKKKINKNNNKPKKPPINKINDDSDDDGRNKKKKKRRPKKKANQKPAPKPEVKAQEVVEVKEVAAPEPEVTITDPVEIEMQKFLHMTKQQLKEELRKRDVTVSGKKEALLLKMRTYIRTELQRKNVRDQSRNKSDEKMDDIKNNENITPPSNNSAKKPKQKKRVIRSPICVVMGHVDTGKTKILDYIRKSRVQDREAGGITQQIGATFLSKDYIKKCTARLKEQFTKIKFKVPGLLFIDTPGHESFSNLRARGSSMCDIAILVVDIMHYLEPQTIESLKLLQKRKAPYIVALNKIDRCIDWKPDNDAPFDVSYKKQKKHTKADFEKRLENTKLAFANEGINSELYSRNTNLKTDVSLVPTSAHTGEGIPDLLYLLCQLTQKYMKDKLAYEESKFKASVLEVKKIEGYGATIDVILSNGSLHPNDTIVVCGMRGPICSKIRALLLPNEGTEMRVKSTASAYKVISQPINASMGVRIACQESLEYALAGSELFVVPRHTKGHERHDIIEQLKDEVQGDYAKILSKVNRNSKGVYVQASTLGSLEALITFLTKLEPPIPISGVGIGDVHKGDVMKAGICVDQQPEYAVILAFNIQIDNDARNLANDMGVKIFEAEIIYHLQEMFEAYLKEIYEARKLKAKDIAVFPVEFHILSPEHVFHNKNPFVVGVEIKKGTLRLNTPICVQRYNIVNQKKIPIPLWLGYVTSIRLEDKDVRAAKKGDKVSVRIEGDDTTKNIQVGRNFNFNEPLISRVTKESIDALKSHFADEVRDDKEMVKHLFFLRDYFGVVNKHT